MKIVYFIDHLRPDGTQFVLHQLVQGLNVRGHAQTVICLNDSWDELFKQKLVDGGAQVRIVGKLALASGYGWWTTLAFLRQERFDVAVTLLFASDVVGRTLAHAARIPWIVTSIQTRDEFYASWQRWLVRRTMHWADSVILNSIHVRDFAISEEGAPADRIVVIPNGISVEKYISTVPKLTLRAQLNLPTDCILLGSIGRLVPQKGFDILLQALAQLRRRDLFLCIAGVGREEQNLRAQARELGLQARVVFMGYRRDVPALMHCLDLYVHASRFEGMPIVILEAMASGCPIVATAVDGTRELIQDARDGWLVPPEDPLALANAIQSALDDPNEARRRNAAALQRVSDYFDTNKVLDAWERVFQGRVIEFHNSPSSV